MAMDAQWNATVIIDQGASVSGKHRDLTEKFRVLYHKLQLAPPTRLRAVGVVSSAHSN